MTALENAYLFPTNKTLMSLAPTTPRRCATRQNILSILIFFSGPVRLGAIRVMFGRLTSLIGGGGGPAFGFVPYPTAEGDDAVLQRPSDNSMWTVTRGKAKVRVCVLLLAYPSRDDAIVFMISAPFICISFGACIPIACSVMRVLHMMTLRCELELLFYCNMSFPH